MQRRSRALDHLATFGNAPTFAVALLHRLLPHQPLPCLLDDSRLSSRSARLEDMAAELPMSDSAASAASTSMPCFPARWPFSDAACRPLRLLSISEVALNLDQKILAMVGFVSCRSDEMTWHRLRNGVPQLIVWQAAQTSPYDRTVCVLPVRVYPYR